MRNKNSYKTKQLVILGLMTAILLLMAWTPLGYLRIGPLAITFNMIPMAICAIVLGPVGGGIAGFVFGLTSFLQMLGIGGGSALGAALVSINPFLAALQAFVPRILDGLLIGFVFRGMRRHTNTYVASAVTGFFSAFLNTVFFMGLLVLLWSKTEYVANMIGGRNVLVFIAATVGVNAVAEMVSATVITAAVATALYRAHVVPRVAEAA